MLCSYLFIPATTLAKLPKALASGVDALILDLEDAVAVQEKIKARANVVAALGQTLPLPVFVRVNALGTPYALDELLEVGAAGPTGIMLPKVEQASDLLTASWILDQVERRTDRAQGSIQILPIIETGKGIAAVGAIASAVRRVKRLMFGAVDFALDLDIDINAEMGAVAHARFAIAVASRAADLAPPVDTAFLDIPNLDRLRETATNARAMGFGSKACIHPSQVTVVNQVFSPSPEEIVRARKTVEAFENAEREGAAALVVDGQMVDYPVVERARRLLEAAGPSASR